MAANKRTNRAVDPRIAAVVIIIALAVVQYVWWQGLVAKPRASSRKPMAGSSMGGGGTMTYLQGYPDAKVETLAGAPDPGDADGIGRDARFDGPAGLALDAAGNICVADSRNNRIRIVASDGRTHTLSGSAAGFQDGPVAGARFNSPSGVAVAPDSSVYVADTGNNRIRCIRNGQVTTVAGGEPGCVDGAAAVAKFNLPAALSWRTGGSSSGDLVVADSGNRRIRVVTVVGTPNVTTLKQVDGVPSWVAASSSEIATALPDLSTLTIGAKEFKSIPADPGGTNLRLGDISLKHPLSVCSAPDGWYVADTEQAGVFLVQKGIAHLLAGVCVKNAMLGGFRDGPGDKAAFGTITGLATDGRGHVFVSDSANNAIRRITLPPAGSERPQQAPRPRWRPGEDARTSVEPMY